MKHVPNLKTLFDGATGQVTPQKLRQIAQKLESAVGCPLAACPVDDPIILRRTLVEQLRSDGASAGTIQALTQCFMGIIRRAAVDGLIAAPPEGPWTRTWQTVLDFAGQNNGAKSHVRSLGAWATEQHLEPEDIETRHLRKWSADLVIDECAVPVVQDLLREWADRPKDAASPESDSIRAERLRKKAAGGTVQTTS